MCKNQKAFTLIELLVVMLIIGILSAIALPQYNKAVEKARATEALIILDQLAKAENLFFTEQGSYTTDYDALSIALPNSAKYYSFGAMIFEDGHLDLNAASKNSSYRFTSINIGGKTTRIYCQPHTEKAIEICRAFGAKDTCEKNSNISACNISF